MTKRVNINFSYQSSANITLIKQLRVCLHILGVYLVHLFPVKYITRALHPTEHHKSQKNNPHFIIIRDFVWVSFCFLRDSMNYNVLSSEGDQQTTVEIVAGKGRLLKRSIIYEYSSCLPSRANRYIAWLHSCRIKKTSRHNKKT